MQSSRNRPPALRNSSGTLERIEQLHPHKMLLYLAIFGSSLIFVFMLIAFSATYNFQANRGILESMEMPKAFTFSTIILLLSSYFVSRFSRAWEQEKLKKLRNLLAISVGLGFLFTLSQYWGWHTLDKSGHTLSDVGSGAYLYVISGIHILHLIGAMFFMTYQFISISNISNDPVRTLIAITNPHQKMRLDMLTTYWHFMDFLWLGLFFYFLFWF
jgi:cytochrome c oxidase subunit 3